MISSPQASHETRIPVAPPDTVSHPPLQTAPAESFVPFPLGRSICFVSQAPRHPHDAGRHEEIVHEAVGVVEQPLPEDDGHDGRDHVREEDDAAQQGAAAEALVEQQRGRDPDGDLQHDETRLPIMLSALQAGGYDIAVASRHVEGGDSAGLPSRWRHMLSDGGIKLAQAFLPVRLTDPPSPTSATAATANNHPASDTIEIVLPDGSRVRVGSGVNLTALRRVVTALRG